MSIPNAQNVVQMYPRVPTIWKDCLRLPKATPTPACIQPNPWLGKLQQPLQARLLNGLASSTVSGAGCNSKVSAYVSRLFICIKCILDCQMGGRKCVSLKIDAFQLTIVGRLFTAEDDFDVLSVFGARVNSRMAIPSGAQTYVCYLDTQNCFFVTCA